MVRYATGKRAVIICEPPLSSGNPVQQQASPNKIPAAPDEGRHGRMALHPRLHHNLRSSIIDTRLTILLTTLFVVIAKAWSGEIDDKYQHWLVEGGSMNLHWNEGIHLQCKSDCEAVIVKVASHKLLFFSNCALHFWIYMFIVPNINKGSIYQGQKALGQQCLPNNFVLNEL